MEGSGSDSEAHAEHTGSTTATANVNNATAEQGVAAEEVVMVEVPVEAPGDALAAEDAQQESQDDKGDCVQQASSTSSEPVMPVLLCGNCRRPIAASADILPERHERAWKDHVYCYQLDLFENGTEVWAYSATNPTEARFDLVRVRPTSLNVKRNPVEASSSAIGPSAPPEQHEEGEPLVSLHGTYSPEHSFFIGYSWCYCQCMNCGAFLGWGFLADDKCEAHRKALEEGGKVLVRKQEEQSGRSADEGGGSGSDTSSDATNSSATSSAEGNAHGGPALCRKSGPPKADFLGIIVTRCTGDSEYPVRAFEEEVTLAVARRKRRKLLASLRTDLINVVSRLTDGLAAHYFVATFDYYVNAVVALPPEVISVGEDEEQEQRPPAERPSPLGPMKMVSSHGFLLPLMLTTVFDEARTALEREAQRGNTNRSESVDDDTDSSEAQGSQEGDEDGSR